LLISLTAASLTATKAIP